MKTKLQLLIIALGITSLNIPSADAATHGNPNPSILPPNATFKGKTMGEWTHAWWQWVLGTEGNVQMFDGTGEFAYVNNNGADGVFFLAKSWAVDEDGNYGVPQVREIVIPSGTPLYVPVMGLADIYPDIREVAKGWGFDTLEEYWADFDTYVPYVRGLSVVVDGKPVASLEDGNLHYLNFVGRLEPVTVVDSTGETLELAGFELSLILAPLTPGEHIIEMKGKGCCGFESNVTYLLTVQPGR